MEKSDSNFQKLFNELYSGDSKNLLYNNSFDDHMFESEIEYCLHKWKIYVGFTETYRYCTICDIKSEI